MKLLLMFASCLAVAGGFTSRTTERRATDSTTPTPYWWRTTTPYWWQGTTGPQKYTTRYYWDTTTRNAYDKCDSGVRECQDKYMMSYQDQYETENYLVCVAMINCDEGTNGYYYKMTQVRNLLNALTAWQSPSAYESAGSAPDVLKLPCLALAVLVTLKNLLSA